MESESRKVLLDALHRRAENLSKIVHPNSAGRSVDSLIAQFSIQIFTTVMALNPESFIKNFLEELSEWMRDRNGICVCGERLISEKRGNLCEECFQNCVAEDEEEERTQDLAEAPTKGVQ